ncbi:DNA circularization N-terminal domain-containing protein [Plastoroseomonas hellenica]|uniref:DNA circularization N-terminal domain-containing protein n=1 Tax=Plastoroseomonas hellenica TaxID=2687306 RepID=UPI001BA58861|nr:DNA circularization N-terminal domain-containing protein [Plastoroseomonas hellenica]MBR0643984.1 hypothetical protein [Plastoroseomonas hellenica]
MSGFLPSLLDGLLGASWRGVPFFMPDSRIEIGRRVIRHWFPGRDDTVHQDLGLAEGAISVTGFLIGVDYVQQAQDLKAAFAQAGPGTLVHPWLGDLEVVLAKPASISFSDREIRVARFDAQFEPYSPPSPSPLDTLAELLDTVRQVRAQIREVMVTALAPARQIAALLAAVASFGAGVEGLWRDLVGGTTGTAGLGDTMDVPLRQLLEIGTLSPGEAYGAAVADRLAAVPAAIAAAGAPPLPPAVGPAAGAAAIADPVIAPEVAASLLLQAGDGIAAQLLPLAPALPVIAAMGARIEATVAAGDIPHVSRQDAIAWRDAVAAALADSAAAAVALAEVMPGVAAPLWTGLTDLRSALIADFNERIGRLPPVETLGPRGGAVSAWLIAQHLAGDDPAAVQPMLNDLVRRNRLAVPGLVPAELPLEYLAR